MRARRTLPLAALVLGPAWLAPAAAQQCAHSEVQHMIPSDHLALGFGNDFGEELALDGNTLVVGATDDPNPTASRGRPRPDGAYHRAGARGVARGPRAPRRSLKRWAPMALAASRAAG